VNVAGRIETSRQKEIANSKLWFPCPGPPGRAIRFATNTQSYSTNKYHESAKCGLDTGFALLDHPMKLMKNKICLITGATSGIG